ncbi:MAG: transposase, partial [Kiritimatiellia bacterium]
MNYDPTKHHRRSIRLKGHDYAGGGMYFVTICAHREFMRWGNGHPFVGATCVSPVRPAPPAREIIAEEWRRCGEIREDVFPGEFVVMPDRFHGMIRIEKGKSALGNVIGAFKAAVTRRIRRTGDSQVAPPHAAPPSSIRIWHRNYYERIVRSEEAERNIIEYIRMNPWRCVQDLGDGLRGMGNPALWNAEKLGVLCSRGAPKIGRLPEAEVYLGGWHSPKEKEIFAWLLDKGRPVIACPAWGIENSAYAPGVRQALEENRLLLLEMRDTAGNLA